jgi:hypothetical protein
MSELTFPLFQPTASSYPQWRLSLARQKPRDPHGRLVSLPLRRRIAPVTLCLPYCFPSEEGYAASIWVSGQLPAFADFAEQPGWANWCFLEEAVVILARLNQRRILRLTVTIIDHPLRADLSRLVHSSRADQESWLARQTPEGSDPHAHS